MGKAKKDERDTFYGSYTLESVEILHCGVCFKPDGMKSSDIVEWIKCSTCNTLGAYKSSIGLLHFIGPANGYTCTLYYTYTVP